MSVRVAGVNFFDIGIRRGRMAEVPGMEGAGVVLEAGEGVSGFAPGQRVAWLTIETHGSYAEQIVLPVDKVVAVPDAIDDETAAAVLLQGLTAHHHCTVCHAVQPGETTLVHAAEAGGEKDPAGQGRVTLECGEARADLLAHHPLRPVLPGLGRTAQVIEDEAESAVTCGQDRRGLQGGACRPLLRGCVAVRGAGRGPQGPAVGHRVQDVVPQ